MKGSTSPTRLRQIALLVEDLPAAERLLTSVLGTEVIFRDARVSRWGLQNILVSIGGDVIEVLAPAKEGTPAGRLLQRRGEGGYMIIMQTLDAGARREYIESRNLARVVFSFTEGDAQCVQYHPKGVPGGMMPELDSHKPREDNPTPLLSPFSPWHPCGHDYGSYAAAMSRCSHLQLLAANCRLAPGDADTEGAARRWKDIFWVRQEGSELEFTNSRLRFSRGDPAMPDGLQSITVGIRGRGMYEEVLARARRENVYRDGRAHMLGVEWDLVLLDEKSESKL